MLALPSLPNVTSYFPPIPIEPLFPNFAFCSSAYGKGGGLKLQTGLQAGGILPYGTNAVTYTIDPNKQGRASQYELPFQVSYAGVKISVQVAGPVAVRSMILIPNDIRGMAAYLANSCVGGVGTGGFVTKSIQGLVDYVTDPFSDLGAPTYPDQTAFVTVTMSSPDISTSAGDYDPAMALFLQQAEDRELLKLAPSLKIENYEIADRIIRYGLQATRMKRLGTLPWWSELVLQVNSTESLSSATGKSSTNLTAAEAAISRRKRRSPAYSRVWTESDV